MKTAKQFIHLIDLLIFWDYSRIAGFSPVYHLVRHRRRYLERRVYRSPPHFSMEVSCWGCRNGRNCRCRACRLVSSRSDPSRGKFHWARLERVWSIRLKLVPILAAMPTIPTRRHRRHYESIALSSHRWNLQLNKNEITEWYNYRVFTKKTFALITRKKSPQNGPNYFLFTFLFFGFINFCGCCEKRQI